MMAKRQLVLIAFIVSALAVSKIDAQSREFDSASSESPEFYTDDNSDEFSSFTFNGASNVYQSGNGYSIISSQSNGPDGEFTYIKVTRPKILITDKIFNCSGVICSKEALKCEVFSEANPSDPKILKTTVKCLNKAGEVLESDEKDEINRFPNSKEPFRSKTTVSRNGEIIIKDSNGEYNHFSGSTTNLTKEEQEELRRNIAAHTQRINQQIAQQQEQIQRNLFDIQRQVQDSLRRSGIW